MYIVFLITLMLVVTQTSFIFYTYNVLCIHTELFINKFKFAVLLTSNEGNVLFNDALSTFYLRLYGVGHMVKDHSDSERGNPLPPTNGLLFPISSKCSFICTTPQTG